MGLFPSKNKDSNAPRLWTSDFNILIGGSFISLAGSFVISIALGLLVLDITGSSLYYSILLAISNAAGVVVPILTASLMDRVSKRKMIYLLDFGTAGLLLIMLLVYEIGLMEGPTILVYTALLGIFSNVYKVVYHSLFPQIVDKRLYNKAYSVESLVTTFAETGNLIGVACYTAFGIRSVLLVSAACYFIAACFEIKIKYDDPNRVKVKASEGLKHYVRDIKECWSFLKNSKGLLALTLLGFFTFYADGALYTIALPHFKFTHANGEYYYMLIMAFLSTGQFWGSTINYKLHINPKKRFAFYFICLTVQYIAAATFLNSPWYISIAQMFIFGILSIITYSTKAAVVYATLPNEMYTRYSGFNQAITMLGYLLGTLVGGAFTEFYPAPVVMGLLAAVIIVICLVFCFCCRKSMKPMFEADTTEAESVIESIDMPNI